MSRAETAPPAGLLLVVVAVEDSTVLDLDQFQARKPPTPTTRTSTNAPTTPMINPALLFAGALGWGCGTLGTVTTEAIVPGTEGVDKPLSGGGELTIGGAGVSTRTGGLVPTGGATVG